LKTKKIYLNLAYLNLEVFSKHSKKKLLLSDAKRARLLASQLQTCCGNWLSGIKKLNRESRLRRKAQKNQDKNPGFF
jgi:hypothetical protein